MSDYFSIEELKKKGFKKVGSNCKISNKVSFYNTTGLLGNNVRIDDDVVLKGRVVIKSNVHIARGCTLSGDKKGIFIENFSTLSNYCQVFSVSDDFLGVNIPGATLTPLKRKIFSKTYNKKITIGKAAIIGAFSIILPGSNIGNFSSVGAFSLIYKTIKHGFYFSNFEKSDGVFKKRNLRQLNKNYKKLILSLKK
jgi:acetyltransferase-like isoleucine patch superfamily enzyme